MGGGEQAISISRIRMLLNILKYTGEIPPPTPNKKYLAQNGNSAEAEKVYFIGPGQQIKASTPFYLPLWFISQ